MTDNERVLREQIEELRGKLRRLEARNETGLPVGPDLVLSDHPFSYEWKGKEYGFDAMEVSQVLDAENQEGQQDGYNRIKRIRELADMPEGIGDGHVLEVFTAAVEKVHALGKSLEEIPTFPPD